MALVDHASDAPFALLNFGDQEGELAAMQDLLERSDVRGRAVTLAALRATGISAALITQSRGADHVFTIKGNAPETFDILVSIDRASDAAGHFAEGPGNARGKPAYRVEHLRPRQPEPQMLRTATTNVFGHIQSRYLDDQ